ncbi:MAG: phosphoribosylamine--glycine ligase [Proteobacteria bacterium]|nr:phosphoribosylamine--glycine ligase [Pseudomonadota bacterium]
MNVLVLGGGGREHVLAWKLRQSPSVKRVYCAPGNAGIAEEATCVTLDLSDNDALVAFAREKDIALTVVGPEAPLVNGVVDAFQREELRIFGPTRAAAKLEGSKVYAKEFMARHGLPTARFRSFSGHESIADARTFAAEHDWARVVKADGLAAGKGVLVCDSLAEVHDAIDAVAGEKQFGAAGDAWLLEEKLIGEEISLFALGNGRTLIPMLASQDYKQAYAGDTGPNTGGMGAFTPVPFMDTALLDQVQREVVQRCSDGLQADGIKYQGVLYFGFMLTDSGPQLLEFNCRFGDPETQPLLMLLESDLCDIFESCLDGTAADVSFQWTSGAAACVVLASGGYPGSYEKGKTITGLATAAQMPQVTVFHAGTRREGDHIVTNGGRVLNVTATGSDLQDALQRAYAAAGVITFEGKQYRDDIGYRAFRHA